jgi:alkyl sulfatase BDS1-like metallo-beta-lactamase superfamily hydrolase
VAHLALRQAVQNMAHGLYEVLPGRINQVRGFDRAYLTITRRYGLDSV